ncbi:MAG: hypothetical protein AMS16_07355 [Planctomycetes bacterium DG_58]|nr:MAG: hypothetical protein AMS16_07355 [Planctomycetes bacterium DG_58]
MERLSMKALGQNQHVRLQNEWTSTSISRTDRANSSFCWSSASRTWKCSAVISAKRASGTIL